MSSNHSNQDEPSLQANPLPKSEQIPHTAIVPAEHWKSRLAVALIMLTLTFVGVVLLWVEKLNSLSAWHYWICMAIGFGIITVLYGAYIRYKELSKEGANIWHDILIWVGVLISFYILHVMVLSGLIGRLTSGIVILNNLALGVFCSGILMDPIFILVGITMFIFAIAMIMLTKYMAVVIVAVGIVAAISAIYLARYSGRKLEEIQPQ